MSDVAVEKSLIPEDPEDQKLITLARAVRARTRARQGACVRDSDGRAYAAASVHLDHLRLSAIAVAVAMAVSSGAGAVEAAALVGEAGPSAEDLEVLRDVSAGGAKVWWADDRGAIRSTIEL